jgi:hypothetical protein
LATLEVEGPDAGWIATIGYDERGELRVLAARDEWQATTELLLSRLLQEPAPSGRVPGQHLRPHDEDALYDMADSLARRKPEYRGERLTGHVSSGSRAVEPGETY